MPMPIAVVHGLPHSEAIFSTNSNGRPGNAGDRKGRCCGGWSSTNTTKDCAPSRVEQVHLHRMRYFVVSKRGPLRHLLYYDLLCFVIVCALTGALVAVSEKGGLLNHGWQVRAALMSAQIGYSLCALPFVIASIPPWKWVFTHCRDSGYNAHGVCVPMVDPLDASWVAHPTADMLAHSTLLRLPMHAPALPSTAETAAVSAQRARESPSEM